MTNPINKPDTKPHNPRFSSGPCAKRPGWSVDALKNAPVGRSHRSSDGKALLKDVIETHREIMGIPDDFVIGITPGSNTGAFEMAMWSMLGERGVDILAWENFSSDWAKDIKDHMKLEDVNDYTVDYGQISDLSKVDTDRDVIFPWNGTTSGVVVPNADWISPDRKGLTFCDATSAVFGYEMPWDKLDVTTWSWQKVLGGEAAHGMIVLSPRAVARLENYTPQWPLPKLFRMTKGGKLNKGIFEGSTINTPSLIAAQDCLDALNWVKSVGGLQGTIERTKNNAAALDRWVRRTDWAEYLPVTDDIRSRTSVCLKIVDPWFTDKDHEEQTALVKKLTKTLADEGAAFDINSYRTAPPGLRIWCGATVETSDIEALVPWLDWAYQTLKQNELQKAA